MSTEGVIAGVVVGIATGCVTAVVATRAARAVQKISEEEMLETARVEGYQEGWHAASNSPVNVRQQYTRLFPDETQTEEGGTTFRTRQRKS
jgi:hypothetical protein